MYILIHLSDFFYPNTAVDLHMIPDPRLLNPIKYYTFTSWNSPILGPE